ncbi:MAG: VCBS repeat-containing protein [Bdellovibrionales bacterium]|nr:VCBS repeat-containing protein [Bdellovibrionales bacterium]
MTYLNTRLILVFLGSLAMAACTLSFRSRGIRSSTVPAGPPSAVGIVPDRWWERPSTCSQPVRVQIWDSNENVTSATGAVLVSLDDRVLPTAGSSSATGSFHLASNCLDAAITSVGFSAGESEKVIYYRDTASETVRFDVTATGLNSGSDRMTIGSSMAFSSPMDQVGPNSGGADGPLGLAVGDFNEDGRDDVVFATYGTDQLTFYFQQSDGTLAGRVDLPTGADGPQTLVAAYLQGPGDLHLDLVVSHLIDDDITILYGNGDGTFSAPVVLSNTTLDRGLVVGDVNGDSYADILVGRTSSNGFDVYLNNGSGSFVAGPVNYAAGQNSPWLALGDYDQDGDLDVASTTWSANQVRTFLNNGAGVFGAGNSMFNGTTRPTGMTDLYGLISAQLNGDSFPDLVYTAGSGGQTLGVILGAATGADTIAGTVDDFGVESSQFTGNTPHRPIAFDMDGDGDLDLAVPANGSARVYVLQNNGAGAFTQVAQYTGVDLPRAIAQGDMNGDGEPDLVVANTGNDTISILWGVP